MKKLITVISSILLIFSLFGCSMQYEHIPFAIDSFDLGYNQKINKAFFAYYNWDGSANGMNIILPEYYNNTKIIGLGGYTGNGFPEPFAIQFTDVTRKMLCSNATK